MFQRLLLASLLVLAPVAPVLAADEDEIGQDVEAPPSFKMPDTSQLKGGLELKPSGAGITDMASTLRLLKIAKALKAKQKVSPEDMQFVRATLKKMGSAGGSSAESLMQLDQALEQLQRRSEHPTESDQMMRDLADGADMDDLPKLND